MERFTTEVLRNIENMINDANINYTTPAQRNMFGHKNKKRIPKNSLYYLKNLLNYFKIICHQ